MSDDLRNSSPSADDLRRQAAGRETLAMLQGIFEAARLIPVQHEITSATLPLTVITGFLGAGKTTLVNRLLTEPHGRRIAVLVNDFGAINIDEELIRSRSADAIGLTNGCACCAIAGDLTKALLRLLQQPEPPDAVVLEASGLADPHGIAQIALANPAIRLDGVLTMVDGATFLDRIDDPETSPTVSSQLMAADLVVLNKTDLMGDRRDVVRARVQAIAGARTIVEVTQAEVPAGIVLGINAKRSSGFQCTIAEHVNAFSSWSASWDAQLDRKRMTEALRTLPSDVIRAKGIFHFENEPSQRFVYQRVGRRDSLDAEAEPFGAIQSRLVVIGASARWDEAAIARLFADIAPARGATVI